MQRLLEAADEIHSAALQILNHYEVDAKAVPLVMAAAAQRKVLFIAASLLMSWTRPWEASRRTGWHPHERWSFYFLNE